MVPSFAIEGGLLLPLVRSLAVAALLSAFGTLLFRLYCGTRAFRHMPDDVAARVRWQLLQLTRTSVGVSVAGFAVWLLVQSADMASAGSVLQTVQAVPTVLSDTVFGHLLAVQVALVAVAGLVLWRDGVVRQCGALGLTGAAVLLQAGHSHAESMYDGLSFLLASQAVHVLGAGAWLGGLLPLFLLVRAAPPKPGAVAARWFSPLGKWAVGALAATSVFQGWVMVASIPGLVGTAYGWMVLVKLVLFGGLFGFAVLNRYRFAPALLRDDPAPARRVLLRSLAWQTGFGLAIVVAAAVLGELVPAMHAQPLWPFPERFTLETIAEDPDFFDEVIGATMALGAAVLLLIPAIWLRHPLRWAALAAALVIGWFAVPHLDLLFVPAYPTSYYQSPTGFAVASIAQGEALFPDHCSACHGAEGRGDGPLAKSLADPPADLTADHLWMHSDGELFWWLAHGIEGPRGGLVMPGFAASLTDDERWALIDFIRARNAGLAFRQSGGWPQPLRAPDLQADCGDRTVGLADLQGGFVRVAIGGAAPGPNPPGVTTVLVTPDPAVRPGAGVCVARDPAVAQVYALVAGLPPGELPATQFLVDAAGWLRAVHHPGYAAGDWNDPTVLSAKIKALRSKPITADPAMDHAHMQM